MAINVEGKQDLPAMLCTNVFFAAVSLTGLDENALQTQISCLLRLV
jgi:hypothetical protein